METLKRLYKYAPEKRIFSYFSLILSGVATVFSVLPYFYFWKLLNELLIMNNTENARNYAFLIFNIYGFANHYILDKFGMQPFVCF